jgi:hypothetical protein
MPSHDTPKKRCKRLRTDKASILRRIYSRRWREKRDREKGHTPRDVSKADDRDCAALERARLRELIQEGGRRLPKRSRDGSYLFWEN